MEFKNMIEKLFDAGKVYFEEIEVYIEKHSALSIETYQGELEKYELAQTGGISVRGLKNGKMGYAYSENISEESIEELIQIAVDSHQYIDSEDIQFLHDGSGEYREIPKETKDFDTISTEEKIQMLLKMERMIREREDRVFTVTGAYSEYKGYDVIANTKGLYKEDIHESGMIYSYLLVKEGEEMNGGVGYQKLKNFSEICLEQVVTEAVRRATGALGANSISSGEYNIIFENLCFSGLLGALESSFSADMVQKGFSLLQGKLGEKIAAESVNLSDDPFLSIAIGQSSFDGEGYPTKQKYLIENGKLNTYMHNLKTAHKDGVSSTGNADRSSYKGGIGIGASHLYLEKGKCSLEEMLQKMGEGLLITDLQGLHSGLDPISGDFSLPANGYILHEGKLISPVNQITVAGNLFSLLKGIVEIGNDVRDCFGGIYTPSVRVDKMSVSGK